MSRIVGRVEIECADWVWICIIERIKDFEGVNGIFGVGKDWR
jgi:hypothetical protein